MLETDSDMHAEEDEDRWLILGMKKGEMIFFNILNFSRLHARFEVTKADILIVKELFNR